MSVLNCEKLVQMITDEMNMQASKAHTSKAEVDISGGIDSAVVAALTCRAFGPDNVIGVYSSVNSSEESAKRAAMTADTFGFKLVNLELSDVFDTICSMVEEKFAELGIPWPKEEDDPTVFGGFRSCIRAPIGRFVNRAFGGGIRQGTGNRDEDELVRFYQKGGDGEVDCNWIEGLFKSEVWELAEYLGVPKEIIYADPTPDLWGSGDQHNDEDELTALAGVPMTYTRPGGPMGTIEWASRENEKFGVVNGFMWEFSDDISVDLAKAGYTNEQIKIIKAMRKMEAQTRHKSLPPPHLKRSILRSEGCVK